jgi:glycosyltransferase involved in cell wall biosynthesis
MPPTAQESFGMAALEAMAAGRPVVATRNGGSSEVVEDGVTGKLVEPGNVPHLGRAILTYARDPQRRDRHGPAGRRRAEADFSLTRCAHSYARLFSDLRGQRAGVDLPGRNGSEPRVPGTASRSRAHVG